MIMQILSKITDQVQYHILYVHLVTSHLYWMTYISYKLTIDSVLQLGKNWTIFNSEVTINGKEYHFNCCTCSYLVELLHVK